MRLKQHESAHALPSGEEEREVFVSCAVTKLPTVCLPYVHTVAELRPKPVVFTSQVMACCAYANMEPGDPSLPFPPGCLHHFAFMLTI